MTRLRRSLTAIAGGARSASRDLLAIAGIGSIAYGLGLVHPTLAFVAVGLYLLLAAGARQDRRAAR